MALSLDELCQNFGLDLLVICIVCLRQIRMLIVLALALALARNNLSHDLLDLAFKEHIIGSGSNFFAWLLLLLLLENNFSWWLIGAVARLLLPLILDRKRMRIVTTNLAYIPITLLREGHECPHHAVVQTVSFFT